MSMFKIIHYPLKFSMESISTPPTHTEVLHRAYKFQRRQYAASIRAVPFWNILPAEIVNASSVKSFKTFLEANWLSLLPEAPVQPSVALNPFPLYT